ncbi:uncharacterized protein FIESC28_03109 [Fusarium coffeatum]|uniref:Uncharacterized protein n=1 Tax=Fusarium coffeatum TaxID=231269 RepID=A0A366S617_9HYPO|nr:uncharacterized protein FIESC28_03109 [Fusarium coffeatum]RBR24110.1 hypothetical protein FIESC28_03109 [Fusarium coffeatum]
MALSTDRSNVYRYCACFPKQVRTGMKYNQFGVCKECNLDLPDQDSVYTEFKNVEQIQYVGTNGLKEKRYLITTIIEQQRFRRSVDKLIRKYGMEPLSSAVQDLLQNGAFSSRYPVKKLFPGPIEEATTEEAAWESKTPAAGALYDDEPSCEHDAAEASYGVEPPHEPPCEPPCEPEVAVEEDECTKDAKPVATEEEYIDVRVMKEKPCDDDDCVLVSDSPVNDITEPKDPEEDHENQHGLQLYHKGDECVHFWYRYDDKDDAANLPLSSQYELMVQLQRYIERACYEYGCREIPTILLQNSWDCNEAVTLDRWMREFLDRIEIFDAGVGTESLQSLFRRLCDIQTANRDRTRLTLDTIDEFLSDTRRLMGVLHVKEYEDLIKKLEVDIGKLLIDFDIKNRSFRQKRDGKMEQIRSERARLDRLEQDIIAEVKDGIEGNQRMVKSKLSLVLVETMAKFEWDRPSEEELGRMS